jgi:hypothetical protein
MINGLDYLLCDVDKEPPVLEGWEESPDNRWVLLPTLPLCGDRKMVTVRKPSCNCLGYRIDCAKLNKRVSRRECRACKGV